MSPESRTAPPATASQEPPSIGGGSLSGRSLGANGERHRGWQIWLHRIRALLFVTVCATFGVLLLILPWTPKWTDNSLLLTSPNLRLFISSGFARGLASGLGMLDLWLGFWEAIHYHEAPKNSGQ